MAVFTLCPFRVPDSTEPVTSGRLRFGLCSHYNKWPDANGTRTGRHVHSASASRPVVTQLYVLNSWHISTCPGRVFFFLRLFRAAAVFN